MGRSSLLFDTGACRDDDDDGLRQRLLTPNDGRLWALFEALDRGWTPETIHELTRIDPWFLAQFADLSARRTALAGRSLADLGDDDLRELKRRGFGDAQLASALATSEKAVRERRAGAGLRSAYKRIDTCAAEFESLTPYLYGTYEHECEADPTPRRKAVILGSGPNRIGQGIEFDYCCCHAVFGLRDEGFETVMVNCNPETVSTDYDTSDRLYFEPLALEDVLAVVERERSAGADVACLVQFGGQTPLKLSTALHDAGVTILGTTPDSIDLAEDRKRFAALLRELDIPQPPSGTASSRDEARDVAASIGFPVVVRPSYVLGGRAMAIVYDPGALDRYMTTAVDASPEHPVLIDRFLEDAFELDVDAIGDATGAVVIAGIMEHIEEAGIHSGDSSCVVPPFLVEERHIETIRQHTRRIAKALGVVGLMNAQFAIKGETVYVLEVNPAGVADGAVPVEGYRRAPGAPGGQGDGRPDARRPGVHARPHRERRLRQVAGVPVRAVPRRRHDSGSRDEIDRRGDGRRGDIRRGVRKGPDGRGPGTARHGDGVHQRQQLGQAERARGGARSCRAGIHDRGDQGHRGVPASARRRGRDGVQGERRPAERGRPGRERRGPDDHQHPARPRVFLRRSAGPALGDAPRRAVHHDADGGRRGRQRDPRPPRARIDGARAAGLPRGIFNAPFLLTSQYLQRPDRLSG